MKRIISAVIMSVFLSLSALGGNLEIRNSKLKAVVDAETGTLRVTAGDPSQPFIDGTWCDRGNGDAKATRVDHPLFGKGESIEISYPDGRVDILTLYQDFDFLFIQPTLVNAGDSEITLGTVGLVNTTLSLPKPAEALKALGTAGLTAVDQHPGSYMYLAIADPESRNGVVGAWLTGDRGSGIVFSGKDGNDVTLEARIDYGRLKIKPGQPADGEIFLIGHFQDARIGLEKYADLVASYNDIHLPPQPDGYCTWYSRPHGGASDEDHVVELSEFAAQELAPYGFDFVQIDDYWQEGERRNGPAKVFDRVDADGPYQGGMKPVADRIVDLGLTAGIWWMPFAGDRQDPFFADKQHWFTKKEDGTPYHTPWGGTALDMTHPEARAFVGFLANRMANEWGYKYFKMDGMWMGTSSRQIYVNNGYNGDDDLGTQTVHNPDMTPIEAHRAGLRQVRKSAGDDVFFLGCTVSQNMRSFGGTFGLVDAMRIGPDNGSEWKAFIKGPWYGANRYFLHRRVWYNDPDPVYVRPSMPIEHARFICSWVSISGQLLVSSEWLPGLPPDRLDLLKRTLPNHGAFARPVDLLENDQAKIWLLQDSRSGVQRNIVGLYNWNEKKGESIDYPMARLGLAAGQSYVGFDFWSDSFVAPFQGALSVELEPGSCAVLSLREASDRPVIVSTSRHITQGVVDIVKEEWNEKEGVLSGRSRLVANDPYEFRIIVPTGQDSWKLASFDAPGAKLVSMHQNGPMIRIKIASTGGGEVDWSARFEKAGIKTDIPARVTGLTVTPDNDRITLFWNAVPGASYQVTRDDGKTRTSRINSLVDADIERGKTYTYQVSALAWDHTAGPPADVSVTTKERPDRPPLPPMPDVSITSLEPVKATVGWGGTARKGKTIENKSLTLDGTQYSDGMGVHADSLLVYRIPEGSKRFVALVGLDDEKKDAPEASVVFEVYGDVKEMGEPPVLLAKSPILSDKSIRTWCFDLELSDRHRELRLVVTDAGDGKSSDHADWVNAGFLTR